MNATLVAGATATIAGFVGYVAGLSAAYPGRSFSLTLLMVGVALVAVGRTGAASEP